MRALLTGGHTTGGASVEGVVAYPGMRLVTLLSRQPDAVVEIGPGPGTHWRVTVPLEVPGAAVTGTGAAPAAVAA